MIPPPEGRAREELRFSAANEEEQGLWRLETETLELPSRAATRRWEVERGIT